MVIRQVNRVRDPKEQNRNFSEERIITLREKLCKIQDVFDEQRHQSTAAELPEDGLERGGILEDSVHVMCTDATPPALTPVIVCCFVVIPPIPLLTTCMM